MPTLLLLLALLAPASEPREVTEEEYDLFAKHLRENFDDIHDVSMRFHHQDPTLGGLLALATVWESGRMIEAKVVTNETGNEAEGAAFIEALRGWHIEGLEGPCRLMASFRIRLVGSDDPAFPERAILTGSVSDPQGRPVHRAQIEFEGEGAAVPPARSNREGIFVRTLIPPGSWSLRCSAEGYRAIRREGLRLEAGQHLRESFVLVPVSPGTAGAADE